MSPDYSVGQRVGDYEVLGVLGAGGMGKVYRVRNTISERIEAMKILLPNLANQKELADRFLREIKVLASLDHPNIAGFRTALTLNDQLVMILEYVEGVTLASRLTQGPIPATDAVNYADQVLAALTYAHKLNVIHRDIKPANMMLTPKGVVKLMDFGIARPNTENDDKTAMTVVGTTLGSLNYMPPEQVKGESVDARSDIYSLGVSLYELVTGQLPFRGDSGYALMAAQIKELPKPPITVRPDLPPPLNEIILIALAKEPAKRFQSADAFRNALKSAFAPAPGPAPAAESVAPVTPLTAPKMVSATAQFESRPASGPVAQTVVPGSNQVLPPVAALPHNVILPPSQPPPPVSNSYRGFYMALGGLLVVVVLFAAAFYVPRRIKTHANVNVTPPPAASSSLPPGAGAPSPLPSSSGEPETTKPPSTDSSVTDASSSGNKSVPPDSISQPASSEKNVQPKNPGSLPSKRATDSQNAVQKKLAIPDAAVLSHSPAQDSQRQPNNGVIAQAPSPDAAELDAAEQQSDQLNSRASAVTQSIEGLRRQQSAQGYGLRGDIVASQERMQADLSRAQSALQQKDAANAKKYLDLAGIEVEKLEKFLGR
jgi:serine/threonine protein kinase